MSYREIRNFTEILKSLGYPRLISMENFRKPNFELVADILLWMVRLYDPTATISDNVEFENERVEFLTSIAALMASKARLKLNTKKLYASDGRAVQELLKFATLLFKASRASTKSLAEDLVPPPIKIQDVKVARTLASEITQSGAKLYDMLQIEIAEKAERLKVLEFLSKESITTEGSRDHDYIVRSVEDIIKNTKQSKEDIKKESEELDSDQKNLDSKIKKKQEELDRMEKRLRRVETEKPQFMDEVEKLEKELEYHYDIYMEKFRNLDYIEKELEKFHKAEDERREEHEKRLQKMRERLYREEVELLRHTGGGEGGRGKKDDSENFHPNQGRGGGGAGNAKMGQRGHEVTGSMRGNDNDDDDDDDDDEEEELSVADKGKKGQYGGQQQRQQQRGGGGGAGGGGGEGSDDDGLLDDDDDDDEDDDEDDDDDNEGSGSDF